MKRRTDNKTTVPRTVRQMARQGGLACAAARTPDERTRAARWAVQERWRIYRQRLKTGFIQAPAELLK